MAEETIEKILKDFGLTAKEAEVYIFLSKHGVLKCADIAKSMKRHKAQIYRILKILESKGLLESTLETPVRFAPVPFEKALDLSIKAKHDEAALMEKARDEVVSYWKNMRQVALESSLQKFLVLEGNQKIFSKISQLVKDAKNEVSIITTIPDVLRADTYGVFDVARSHPLKSNLQFRLLTEFSSQHINAIKTLFQNTKKSEFNVKVRNPDLGFQLSPRMIIRDTEEMLFFITKKAELNVNLEELCLWTNCQELVHSFLNVFEDLWHNSTDIELKIAEIETGKPTPKTYAIPNGESAKKKYEEILQNAKEEIVFITSADGLIGLSKRILLLKKWIKNGVFVRIMAPIVNENFSAAQNLSECCFVKHTPASYMNTTLVDGQHLFQFKNQSLDDKAKNTVDFENAVYTSDKEYVDRTRNMVNDIWKNAHDFSDVTVVSLKEFLSAQSPLPQQNSQYTKMMGWLDYPKYGLISEKHILDKLIHGKKIPAKDPSKDIVRYYGSRGMGIIHPPQTFNLPDMLIMAFLWNEKSSFGAENRLTVYSKINSPKGYFFLPVAMVGDNPDAMEFVKGTQAGTPSEKSQLVKENELQVRLQNNTMFAGWTVPISLNYAGYVLPPACILIEAYGDIKTALRKSSSPSGRMQISEHTLSEASLTFFHPSSKYSGPGTDAFLNKYAVCTTYPPSFANNEPVSSTNEVK